MQKEIYKPVVGYECAYEVSNFGNVKSINRSITKITGIKQPIRDKLLNKTLSNTGYYSVGLSVNCKRKTALIHHLVAESFLNHKLNGHTFVINHKDENKLNNHIDNLEIVTKRDNTFLSSKIRNNKKYSKFIGVYYVSDKNKKWVARLRINGKTVRKHFLTEEEAKNYYLTQKNIQNELSRKI